MARTVADAAALLTAMAGVDPADRRDQAKHRRERPRLREVPRCRRAQGRAHRRCAKAVLRLQRRRPISVVEAAIADMKAQGAVIVDPANIPTASKMDGCENQVLLYEFKADLNKYLKALGPEAPVHSLDRADRVQLTGDGTRDAVLRPGASAVGREEGTADHTSVPCGADEVPRAGARAGHRPGDARNRGSTRSLRQPADRRGPPISSTAITSAARARRQPRSRAIRASRCRPGTPSACRSGCRSSAEAWSEPRLIALALRLRAGDQASASATVQTNGPESLVPSVPGPVPGLWTWDWDQRLGTRDLGLEHRAQRELHVARRTRRDVVVAVRRRIVGCVEQVLGVHAQPVAAEPEYATASTRVNAGNPT